MSAPVVLESQATVRELATLLRNCDQSFIPTLSSRVDIDSYANKLATLAINLEAWVEDELIGLVAVYCDQSSSVAFITNVCVAPAWRGKGVASKLLAYCVHRTRGSGLSLLNLELGRGNLAASALYLKHGFIFLNEDADTVTMALDLKDMANDSES